MKHKQNGFGHLWLFGLIIVLAVGVAGYEVWIHRNGPPLPHDSSLPDISYLKTHKSDRFLVDMDVVQGGNPYKGVRSIAPHTGGHAQFGDGYKTWPKGGTAPSNYPPIYAVADGVVNGVDYNFKVGDNTKYDISIEIAQGYNFDYSIEPFVSKPNGFYKPFVLVHNGQKVKKGQIIGYMYLTQAGSNGSHIHFDIHHNGQFMAPAIFTPDIVQAFHDHWGDFGYDGNGPNSKGVPIPACMGYKLSAAENPFGTGAVDCLN
ncbi:MAG TPA: peptidoglycan DD-metalloendopeptidase family protein [Candidatus Saccharimonadales bacterium]|nr:peptidoglycan DD-metalloendopeptidase family protein [Candidatus Saccharimonadales bacterium]